MKEGIKSEKKAIKQGAKGYFLEGTAPGPGRPKGSKSIKDAVRKWLENNPKDFEEFIGHFIKKNRELAWQMLEGRPPQDITTGGQPIPFTINIIKDESKPDEGQNSKTVPDTI